MGQTSVSNLLIQVPGLLKGLSVRTQDGRYLGRVIAIGETSLEAEGGFFLLHYFYVDYLEISSAWGGSIYLPKGIDACVPLSRRVTSLELNSIVVQVRQARQSEARRAPQAA